jgi:hypothetical protein
MYASVSEIGNAENVSKSYVSRFLRLALLAPDIAKTILAGTADHVMTLEQLEQPRPPSWEEQGGWSVSLPQPCTAFPPLRTMAPLQLCIASSGRRS